MKKETKAKSRWSNFTRWFGVLILKNIFRFLMMPKIRYESENVKALLKSKEPLVIISNHCYWYDPLMFYVISRTSKISVVAAKEVLQGFKGGLLRGLGCIPVDRTTMDLVCLRECASRVRQGDRVGIFPEGMINFEEEMLPFKAGVSLISSQTGAKVVPAYISGDYRLFGHVQVMIGEAVDLSEHFSTPATAAEIAKGTDVLYERMCALKEKLLASMTEKQRNGVDNFRAKFMKNRASAIEEQQKEPVNK